jgi:hypothetical protein
LLSMRGSSELQNHGIDPHMAALTRSVLFFMSTSLSLSLRQLYTFSTIQTRLVIDLLALELYCATVTDAQTIFQDIPETTWGDHDGNWRQCVLPGRCIAVNQHRKHVCRKPLQPSRCRHEVVTLELPLPLEYRSVRIATLPRPRERSGFMTTLAASVSSPRLRHKQDYFLNSGSGLTSLVYQWHHWSPHVLDSASYQIYQVETTSILLHTHSHIMAEGRCNCGNITVSIPEMPKQSVICYWYTATPRLMHRHR